MHPAVDALLHHPKIWRGDQLACTEHPGLATGHSALDRELPGAGWPVGGLTDLVARQPGSGELRLLLPALAALSQAGRQIVLIAPPHIPYAPAWQAAGVDLARLSWLRADNERDRLWALEQTLREPSVGAVVGWLAGAPADRLWRRLQLAAETGGGSGFILRGGTASTSSPVGLRLQVEPVAGGLSVQVLKRRGAPLARPVLIPHENRAGDQPLSFRFADAVASPLPASATVTSVPERTLRVAA